MTPRTFSVEVGPSALLASERCSDATIWQLLGAVDELSLFEGVGAIARDGVNGGRHVLVVCDMDTPAGKVLMHTAQTVANQAREEDEYLADDSPNASDTYSPAELDWLFPIRKTFQLGGKLKNEVDQPAVQRTPTQAQEPADLGQIFGGDTDDE